MWGLILLATLIYVSYLWMKKKNRYWAEKGVLFEKPLPLFGNMLPVFTMQKSIGNVIDDVYNKYPNEAVIGIYEMTNPMLIVKDQELVEKILVKDFSHFTDHPMFGTEDSIFSNGLFNLTGSVWRSMRYKVSPTFSTGKLKSYFPLMVESSEELKNLVKKSDNKNIKTIVREVALDIIATAVFGIEIKDLKARKQFFEMANNLFYGNAWRVVKQNVISAFPTLSQRLGLKFFPIEADEYFRNLLLATTKQREMSGIERNDYLQYIVELKKKGQIKVHSNEKDQDDNYLKSEDAPAESIEISDSLLVGQLTQFLVAGFDPLLNATTYVLFQLSKNQDVQKKVRNEINEILKKHGSYTYAAIKEMAYLEQCVLESLRVLPLVYFHTRMCTKSYTLPDGVVIDKGTKISIPANAIHMDEQYFDEPTKFNPDRFASDPNPTGYTAFGLGPRMCIGMRYALVEVKLLVARIVENFTFTLNPKTDDPLRFNKAAFPVLESEVILDLQAINKY